MQNILKLDISIKNINIDIISFFFYFSFTVHLFWWIYFFCLFNWKTSLQFDTIWKSNNWLVAS